MVLEGLRGTRTEVQPRAITPRSSVGMGPQTAIPTAQNQGANDSTIPIQIAIVGVVKDKTKDLDTSRWC